MLIIAYLNYLLWQLFVVEHGNEHMHELFGANFPMETNIGLVHTEIEQAQGQEDYLGLSCLQTFVYLIGRLFGIFLAFCYSSD